MHTQPPLLTLRRPYARRLPPEYCRRALLSIRIHDHARSAVRALAHERGMSISEYCARLLSDHLTQLARTRGRLPVFQEPPQ